jgi:hypothetical protein
LSQTTFFLLEMGIFLTNQIIVHCMAIGIEQSTTTRTILDAIIYMLSTPIAYINFSRFHINIKRIIPNISNSSRARAPNGLG